MPELPSQFKKGMDFFANNGEDSGLPDFDDGILDSREHKVSELKYGEYAVSTESFMFLRALEPQFGKEWILDNLGTGEERIRLDEKGDIVEFYCDNTEIVTLPKLPDSLEILDCSNTPLRSLPDLPAGLEDLSCHNTEITELPEPPDSLRRVNIENTPLARDKQKSAEIRKKYIAKGITIYT